MNKLFYLIFIVFLTVACKKDTSPEISKIIWENRYKSSWGAPASIFRYQNQILQLYYFSHNTVYYNTIVAYDIDTGKELNRYQFDHVVITDIEGIYQFESKLAITNAYDNLTIFNLDSFKVERKIEIGINKIRKITGIGKDIFILDRNNNIKKLDLLTSQIELLFSTKQQNGVFQGSSFPDVIKDVNDNILISGLSIEPKSIKLYLYSLNEKRILFQKQIDSTELTSWYKEARIHNGKIYCNYNEKIECRALTDGKLIWSKDFKKDFKALEEIFFFNNNIFITSQGSFTLHCLKASDGEVLWQKNGISTEYAIKIENDLFGSGILSDITTGSIKWQFKERYCLKTPIFLNDEREILCASDKSIIKFSLP